MRDAFRTIVGGRSGKPETPQNYPRGIEVLLKKASVDKDFAEVLVRSPSEAAQLIGLALEESEKTVLESIPEGTLRGMIRKTVVKRTQITAFKTMSASLMIAAVITGVVLHEEQTNFIGGISPYDEQSEEGRRNITVERMHNLRLALEVYKQENGDYLPSEDWRPDADNPLTEYLTSISFFYDAWNRPYHYQTVEKAGIITEYVLKSYGPDGIESEDDIYFPE